MQKTLLKLKGNRVYIDGPYPLKRVRELTSYAVPNAFFSKAYKSGRWDGRKHLFKRKDHSFPLGLLNAVVEGLKEEGCSVTVEDSRPQPPLGPQDFSLETIEFGVGKYDYQLGAAQACVSGFQGILDMATNAGKSATAAAVTKYLGVKTIFIVPGLDLLRQAREGFSKYLGIPLEDIGCLGDGKFHIGDWITVASVKTLAARLKKPELADKLNYWDCVWLDECHTVGSDNHYEACAALEAYYRFGISGTPLDRTDGANMRLIAQTGEVLYKITNKELIERGVSVQPYIEFLKVEEPELDPKAAWDEVYVDGIVENERLNEMIAERAHEACAQGQKSIVMLLRKSHGEDLAEKITKLSDGAYGVEFINGEHTSEERGEFLRQFSDGDLGCIVCTDIFKQGIDVDCIDLIVFAGGGKAKIGVLQKIGRGLRSGKGRDKVTIAIPANFCHKHLIKHTLKTIDILKKEDCFIFVNGN